MNLYLIELVFFLVVALFLIIIFKAKKFHNLGLALSISFLLFVVCISGTYVFEKPKFDITSEVVNLEVNEYASVAIPHTTYHMKDVTSSVQADGNINYNKTGSYKIQYQVPTITGKYSFDQTVNVVDMVPPTITLKGDKTYNLSYSDKYKEPGYTIEDNSFEDLSDKVKTEKEQINNSEYNIVYTVEDSSGNTGIVKRKVYIVDDVPPTINLKGSSSTKVLLNKKYTEKGATVEDGDLSDEIKISGKVNTSKVGTYKIKYTVSDKTENKAEKIRTVTVYKEQETETPKDKEDKKATTSTQTKTPSNKGKNTGIIYLTFDDGPSSSITPKILDILKKKNVKATFFILKRIQ